MTNHPRRIDHLVLAVHDLDSAAGFYDRLGFQVGARNRHPWGTENHVIQFASSFLELITVADAELIPAHAPHSFSFGQFIRDYLSTRQGLAMVALDSADAEADAADYAREGIGDYQPFTFERSGRAADGTETHVAFTLAFATDERLRHASFFVCQQHHPEAFWSPPLQRHGNGSTNVSGVCLRVEHPADHSGFLRVFTGGRPSDDGRLYGLEHGGRLELESTAGQNRLAGFTGFTVSVPDLGATGRQLAAERIPFEDSPHRIVIPPDQAFGAEIAFANARLRSRPRTLPAPGGPSGHGSLSR
ncbi:VOC family protein [Segeticoccus rhizosphaerae]|jgi:catechol 2,3-dioxygenase-like lactoylglutathione lyase family enzyme|uniref:VOC family protein n=1 Tax=Segeticoccus rhizosphaerae TaxID=1104777 RepID=UPI0010C150E9|nr:MULTISPECIES: VOC family protein [Intrasporangiaceae]